MKSQIIRDDIEISVCSEAGLELLQRRTGIVDAPAVELLRNRDALRLSVARMLEHLEAHPAEDVVVRRLRRNFREQPVAFYRHGTILDEPTAWLTVREGWAIPADEDCRLRAGLSEEDMKYRQRDYRRSAAGIAPEDFEIFDAGVIVGYNADQSFKPGPNWNRLSEFRKRKDEEDDGEEAPLSVKPKSPTTAAVLDHLKEQAAATS